MPNRNDSWGIEVGANAIKALRLVRKKGQIFVADYEIIPFKKILTTPDINVDEAIQVNLDQFLSRHNIAKSTVMISVPGHMAFARSAKLPPVDPKKIPDIVKFEAVQQIPFPIEQVEWDYQIFSREDSPDVEVSIVAITRERVAQYLNNYYTVGLAVDGLTLSPMAVYNAMAYEMDLAIDSPGVIFLDIGTSATDVIIAENGQLWIRPLPIGGNNFTEALVRAFKLSFPKAERLKREAGTSKYARQIFQAMRPVFADLVQEVQRTLGHYQTVYRDSKLTRMVCLGSTFRLPGMQKFLKQQLQLEVIRPDGFKKIKVTDKEEAVFAENALNLATAYGLALQGLELEKVNINILPRRIIRQRLWREKGLWFGAAAGLMVTAVSVAGARLWIEQSAWQTANVRAEALIKKATGDAAKNIADWNEVSGKANPTQQIENIRGILDYRDVWPKVMQDLDLAAKSLHPQKELLDNPPDYVNIRKIPRGERRRVIIDSVTSRFEYAKITATGGAPPAGGIRAAGPAAAAA
ncbi:MAG: type IV pilus assembly protein PilM, partial [Planctomycetota bacterium]|nr:type IV pilus assembly protein PilM [Planctomycetota bacterium]